MAQSSKTSIIIIVLLAIAVLGIAIQFNLSPTGLVASEGSATVEVAGTTAIDVVDTQINLSTTIDTAGDASAYVATNATSATINSFDNVSNENWLNRTGAEARLVEKDNLTVNNTGTTMANITLAANATSAAVFGVAGGDFWVKITNGTDNNAASGCEHIQAAGWTQYTIQITNTTDLCGKLPFYDGNDTIDLWIQWQVPAAAIARVYNSTLTISAAQSE
ncbi:MAG: hypothetical protein QF475_01180 [Candidatus Undinarchaeales archaeon]|jgi:hypothetical protein|nr:hypothetical protein [Candidatus Undinarchaeales archaeon]